MILSFLDSPALWFWNTVPPQRISPIKTQVPDLRFSQGRENALWRCFSWLAQGTFCSNRHSGSTELCPITVHRFLQNLQATLTHLWLQLLSALSTTYTTTIAAQNKEVCCRVCMALRLTVSYRYKKNPKHADSHRYLLHDLHQCCV